MRVEWKTIKYDESQKSTLTVQFPCDLLFFSIIDTQLRIARYGRMTMVERPDSVDEQLEYLLKIFKDEGSQPEHLVVKIVARKDARVEVDEFSHAISKYRLNAKIRRMGNLDSLEFRFSLLTGDFWMREMKSHQTLADEAIRDSIRSESRMMITSLPSKEVPVKPLRRVLIVEDSPPIQKLLQKMYAKLPGVTVVGTEDTVAGAVNFINHTKVDFISLDMKLKDGTGVEFLKKIDFSKKSQAERMDCVLVTDCSPSEGGYVLDAMELGATAYLQKPQVKDLNIFSEELEMLIEGIAADHKTAQTVPKLKPLDIGQFDLIAIGSSTGGTEVVAELIQKLPRHCPPLLIVQHMPPDFTRLYAERLTRQTGRKTNEVVDSFILTPGQAYLASGGYHMVVKKMGGAIKVLKAEGDPINRFKPSVSALFQSIGEQKLASKTLAIMLTGMGYDGAKEMLMLKKSGAVTIGQSQESCTVYGMPRAAAELGALSYVASPAEMVGYLKLFGSNSDTVLKQKEG